MTLEQLASYSFADEHSLSHVVDAVNCLRARTRGAFLVTGPAWSGKTHLVSSILAEVGFSDRASRAWCLSGSDAEISRGLAVVSLTGVGWFDNVRRADWPSLLKFVSSPSWPYRPFRKIEAVSIPNNSVVILSGNLAKIPAAVAERFRVIRLCGGEFDIPF